MTLPAGNLTTDDARRGQQAAAVSRHERMLERGRQGMQLHAIADRLTSEDLPVSLLQGAVELADKIAQGADTWTVESALDAERTARALETMVRVARLLAGQSTSNTAVIHASGNQDERIAQLQARAAALGTPTATTAVGTTPAVSTTDTDNQTP